MPAKAQGYASLKYMALLHLSVNTLLINVQIVSHIASSNATCELSTFNVFFKALGKDVVKPVTFLNTCHSRKKDVISIMGVHPRPLGHTDIVVDSSAPVPRTNQTDQTHSIFLGKGPEGENDCHTCGKGGHTWSPEIEVVIKHVQNKMGT